MQLITTFHRNLEATTGMPLQLRIHDNRSTMLSVSWKMNYTKVSLHRIFLGAPRTVVQALACYLKKETDQLPLYIKYYINQKLSALDYSNRVDRNKLYTQGAVYNLKKIYDQVNREYFNNNLDLLITWYGQPRVKSRSRLTFGLYHHPLRLIKIHRMLDHPNVPDYVVAFIIYHEMLHHVCPAYYDKRGKQRIHNKEFKELEVQFRYYHLAQKWIKEHHQDLFKGL